MGGGVRFQCRRPGRDRNVPVSWTPLRPPYSDGAALVGYDGRRDARAAPDPCGRLQILRSDTQPSRQRRIASRRWAILTAICTGNRALTMAVLFPCTWARPLTALEEKLSHKECLVEMTRWIRSIIPRASAPSACLGPLVSGSPMVRVPKLIRAPRTGQPPTDDARLALLRSL